MRPEYYSDLYRQYATFIRSYGEEPIFKIASGSNEMDLNWTEVMMANTSRFMDGFTLHNYTVPGVWEKKGDSVDFDADEWNKTMAKAYNMENVVSAHSKIMDKYDPEKKIDLIVDEWGTWFDVLPGTNPGFLYQQNTLRDAVSGMLTLHTFHDHGDRVRMANIAQMVNVLQAMILTEGEDMVLTPTYHLFRMMKPHMDADALEISCKDMIMDKEFDISYPRVSVSASEKNGAVTISMCNTSIDSDETVEIEIKDFDVKSVKAEIMTAEDMHAHNTFDEPENIKPEEFNGIKCENGVMSLVLPAKSVLVAEIG